MNLNMMRILSAADCSSLAIVCVACGLTITAIERAALAATPLSVIVARGSHTCAVAELPGALPETPEESPRVELVRLFLQQRTTKDAGAVTAVDDLYEAFRPTAPDIDRERFGGYLRAAIPSGVRLRRTMVAGDRRRRAYGLRLLDG